jgi:hypothetical protein
MRRQLIAEHMQAALRAALDEPRLRLLGLEGERPSIDGVREPWIDVKYGPASPDDWFGVVPATAQFERAAGKGREALRLIVKVNPRFGLARNLIPWIAKSKSIRLARPYWKYRNAAEVDHTADREFHVYELAAGNSRALQRVLPRYYGGAVDPETGERALFIERLANVARLDASGRRADWPIEAISAAFGAAAAWQAEFWGADASSLPWAGPRITTDDMLDDEPLFRDLVNDAHARFPGVITSKVKRRRHRLIDTMDGWHRVKDQLPGTLAHNDFNQRNVGFRPEVVALDWEIATCNTAHRDLVEMLTFVMPPGMARADIDRLVEAHRATLADMGVEPGLDRDLWMEGFRSELKVEAINRLGMQCIFQAAFSLAYFERINANMERLLDLYD